VAASDPLMLVHAHLAKEPPALDEVAPEVPKGVAAIVARLLSKDPERRYQTTRGVAEDLEEALRRWHERGTVEPFALGRKDFSLKLRLSQVLVGRAREVEQIGASFARAAGGEVELLLIGGPSGIGKTALVRTVYRDIAKAGRGLLIAGKHDQLARSTLYTAMAQAFGALVRQWLASPDGVLGAWQERIRKEVGDNARLIADVVPELDLLMGKLAPVQQVHGEQVQNRQKLTWLNFVRAITAPNAPLVMFLDDMQWADSATLLILQTLLTDVERRALLVIAAYRDNETPPEHPLWKLVEAVDKSGAKVSSSTVGPLSEEQVHQWTARTLESEAARVEPLSRVLWQKTRGNPFFLEQLMLLLHRQGQVMRDPESGEWRWNREAIERAQVTDNVVALLTAKVQEMPEATQHLLGFAACAGHAFRLKEIERLSGWERERVTAALWPALREELVVPVDGGYRPAQALRGVGEGDLDAEYRFLHDRVQQASYERISPEQRGLSHLEIGRRLLGQYRSEGGRAQDLVELVRHLNLGAERMEAVEERKDLARLNLDAARAAKEASSHRLMVNLLETALSLLGEEALREEPALFAELSVERLEAAFLLREFDDVEARALSLLAMPLPAVPRLATQEIWSRTWVATAQFARGEELGLVALAEWGVTFPDTEEACLAVLLLESVELDQWFERHPDGFDRMPIDPSLEHLLVDALVVQVLLCAALGRRPMLGALAISRRVLETIRRDALTPVVPFLITTFAQTLSATTGKYRRAARWIEPGVRIAERMASPMLAECLSGLGVYTVYSRPIDEAAEVLERAVSIALKVGSIQGTSWGLANDLFSFRVWRGQPLGQVDARRRARWGLMQRAGDVLGNHYFQLTECWCDVLMDPAGASRLLGEEPLSRGSRSFLADGDWMVAEYARILEAHLFLLGSNFSQALSRAREADQHRANIYGMPPVARIPLWLALSAAKCWHGTTGAEEQARLCGEIEDGLTRLAYLAEGCAENFLHEQRLIEAEYARVHGKTEEAMAKYDEAIELAREQRFLHIEALSAQLCAEFHLQAGRSRIGALYLREARDAYTRWGALSVVAHLEAKYPTLRRGPVHNALAERTSTASTTSTTGDTALDVNTAVRAAQALASELDPTSVVGRLMELVLANAGAQRGALVLREGDTLSVVARLSVEGAHIETGLSEPLGQSPELPATVLQYVARTSEPLVIGDASADARFAADPYLAARTVLSLLALPLTHRGRLVGVLYLEHRGIASAFPPARVELLSVLAAQAAIAVENALLYRDLETKVAQRTAELRIAKEAADRASQAKSDFLSSMSHELRTPLNGILGYAQILQRLPDMPQQGREGAQIIRKSGEHLLTLINDVLDLAKIEAGKMDIVPKEFHFPAFVRTVANLCRVRAEHKGLSFSHELRGPALQALYADEKRLTQVLLNLLGNASKFTQQGGIKLRVDVMEEHRPARREVRFQVEDTGPGIAPEHLSRIFEPFEQVGDQRARSEGTGLGLALTKKIVEQMGGSIEVQSELGKGSVFTVTLEFAEAERGASAAEALSWEKISGYRGERRTILVVDDNPDNRSVLRDLLVPLGFELFEASSGEAMLQIAVERRPSLILMDLAMPGMDGYEATSRLRQMPELGQVVILASSASTSNAEQQKSIRAGCDAFLCKPVQASALLDELSRFLGVEWIRSEDSSQPSISSAPAVTEGAALRLPAAEDLALLLKLAGAGRIGNVLQEADRIEQSDARLGPWLGRLRTLAQSFQIRQLQEFLQAYVARDP
jgi:predicted ATPase/signal transduction histidine kinase/ActR/RegA family two-component response regulator